MSRKSKLFFENTDGWSNNFPVGGVPLYNNDVKALENTSKMYGSWARLRNFNCIIDGCLVDELNTTTKTVKITEGHFIINGIVYFTEEFTTTYPFELIQGTEVADTRVFKNGDVNDVAIEFSHTIKTTGFSTYNEPNSASVLTNIKPTNITGIFFDPFTNQRLEYIERNIMARIGYTELLTVSPTAPITKTQTDKSVVGTALIDCDYQDRGRWWNYGWQVSAATGNLLRINNTSIGLPSGSNEIILTTENLPPLLVSSNTHAHQFTNAYSAHQANIGGGITFDYKTSKLGANLNLVEAPATLNIDSDNHPYAFLDLTDNHTHSHTLVGADGFPLQKKPITINPKATNYAGLVFVGADTSYYLKNIGKY
jgi:hypothetical protein